MVKTVKVVSQGERWAVEEDGAAMPRALFRTQGEAWERAKSIARKERAEALLYGRNGALRARSAYSPKG
jgi:hypothetical protein